MTRRVCAIATALAVAAACTSQERRRKGNFELRTDITDAFGHRTSRTALVHEGSVIAPRVGDSAVDPRHPDRIVYTTAIDGTGGDSATYLFDAKTQRRWRMADEPLVVHPAADDNPDEEAAASPFAPDGRLFYAGNDVGRPRVFDLDAETAIDLTDAINADGRRIDMRAKVWSPDGTRLAVIVGPLYPDDIYDLAVVTLSPLRAQYVATMRGQLPLWTSLDFRWAGDTVVTAHTGRNGPIAIAPGKARWTNGRPAR